METLFKAFIDWIKLAVLERQDDDFNLAIIQDASTFVYLQGATPIKLAFAAPASLPPVAGPAEATWAAAAPWAASSPSPGATPRSRWRWAATACS